MRHGGMHFSECVPLLYLIDKQKHQKQMASIKVKFRPSTVADHEGTIYYQIIHERKVRQLLSDYKVFSTEWDEFRSMVTTTQKSERKPFILSIRERIRWDVERLTRLTANWMLMVCHTLLMMLSKSSTDTRMNTPCSTIWRVSSQSSNRTARSELQRPTSPLSTVSRSSGKMKI